MYRVVKIFDGELCEALAHQVQFALGSNGFEPASANIFHFNHSPAAHTFVWRRLYARPAGLRAWATDYLCSSLLSSSSDSK